MTSIPSFLECKFSISNKVLPDKIGIYKITALSKCEYNSTFNHDFTNLKRLDNVWITSYELESLLRWNCLEFIKIHSFICVIPQTDFNPLANYARDYYEKKKAESKDSPIYLYYKICALNSLYGKFIERREQDESDYSIRGPNYNPAIASLITGFTRAQMHDIEHKTNAIHSATDAVFTCEKMNTDKELGGISLEGNGTLQLFRNKLYLYYDKEGKLIKTARHGFHGSVEQLEMLWQTRSKNYQYQKIPKVGEYFLHRNLHLKLFGMNTYNAKINIDWSMLNG